MSVLAENLPSVLGEERSEKFSLKEHYLRYIDKLVRQKGPSEEDYSDLDAWMVEVDRLIKAGYISPQDVASVRARFGDMFSSLTFAGFSLKKPHGYAGDYEIIDRIYQSYVFPEPHLSKWDRYAQRLAVNHAVRNRKTYFHELLGRHSGAKQGRTLRVLNVASGPGRDMFEYLSTDGSNDVYFDCVEQDQNAINYSSSLCHAFLDRITFMKTDALRFRARNRYDIVWSAGLFDYFGDRVFKAVLKRLMSAIAPGGELVIGNFSNTNPSRGWMELCEWIVYHRSPEELLLLAEECGIPRANLTIGQESQGVNLFLHITCPEHNLIQSNECRVMESLNTEIPYMSKEKKEYSDGMPLAIY